MDHEEEESDSASNCSNLSDGTLLHQMVQKLKKSETREDPWISLADALDPAEELPDPANAPTGDWYNPANPLSSAWTPCKIEVGTSSKAAPHSRPVTIKAKAKTSAKPLVRQKALKTSQFLMKVKTERNEDESMFDKGARAAAALDLGAPEEPMQKRCKHESHDADIDRETFLQEIQNEIDKIEETMEGLIASTQTTQTPEGREITRKLIEALAAEKQKWQRSQNGEMDDDFDVTATANADYNNDFIENGVSSGYSREAMMLYEFMTQITRHERFTLKHNVFRGARLMFRNPHGACYMLSLKDSVDLVRETEAYIQQEESNQEDETVEAVDPTPSRFELGGIGRRAWERGDEWKGKRGGGNQNRYQHYGRNHGAGKHGHAWTHPAISGTRRSRGEHWRQGSQRYGNAGGQRRGWHFIANKLKHHGEERVRRNGLRSFMTDYPRSRVAEFQHLNDMDLARYLVQKYVTEAED